MQIKEIELLSGMSRANVRFYEAEGLIDPARTDNGYRDYSDSDLQILKRIKLLRILGVSLDTLKHLQTGTQNLNDTLSTHIEQLMADKLHLEQSQSICQQICADGALYQTLDAQHYLELLERANTPSSLPKDVLPCLHAPWCRFFARGLDTSLYTFLWNLVLGLVFHIPLLKESIGLSLVNIIVSILIMFALEPFLLSKFGTTFGKWVFGLSVVSDQGGHLTHRQAWERVWGVFIYGDGCYIPFYSLYRNYKCYYLSEQGLPMPWQGDNCIIAKDSNGWCWMGYLGAHGVFIGILVLVNIVLSFPPNRGDLSMDEFIENYNYLSDYYDVNTNSYMDETGQLQDNFGEYTYIVFGENQLPIFTYTQEHGMLTGLQMNVDLKEDTSYCTPNYQDEINLVTLAFAQAQDGGEFLDGDIQDLITSMSQKFHEDFIVSIRNLEIVCDINLHPQYFLHFSIKKES